MRKARSSRGKYFTAVILIGTAAGLYHGPESIAALARSAMQDAVRPGTKLLHWGTTEGRTWIADRFRSTDIDTDRIAELEAELAAERAATRAALAQTALLNEKVAEAARNGIANQSPSPGNPLFVPELLRASVLGHGTRTLWKEGKLIDKGSADGLTESLLVLDDERTLIDQGAAAGVDVEQEVYAGRCVLGRIATVGRWTSSVERVTDKHYRGLAQIARTTSAGLVLGAEGIIEGDGTATCRLREIPVTDPVEVGDDVYTGGRDGRMRSLMYYGKVVDAKLNDGGTAWEIRVKPAVNDSNLKTLNVLRTRVNPHRMLAE